jgi:PST family polysaccharide transporter
LIFVVIQEPSDYIYVPILNGFGFIIGGIISLWIIFKNFRESFILQKISILKLYFKESSHFFLSRLSSVGYSNSNTFLVGIILSPQFVTYYYLADKAVSVILSVFDPIIQSIYPYLAKKFNLNFLVKLLTGMLSSSIIIIIVVFLSSDYLSIFLLKEVNELFTNTLTILLFIIPVSLFYVMMGAPLLLARGYKKEFNSSIIYGFIIHLIILSSLYTYYEVTKNSDYTILYLFAGSLLFSKIIVMFIRTYYVYKYKLYQKGTK